MKVDLSIIIVNYNTPKLTLQCVKSIIKSHPDLSYEIIVVDNGSGKPVNKKSLGATVARVIKNDNNLGFAKANNQGIRVAKGKYILLLNSDTKVKEDAMDKLYQFAKNTNGVGVVGAKLLNPKGGVQPSCYRLPTLVRAIGQYWFGKKVLDKYAPKGNDAAEVEALVGAAFLITPAARESIGLLDKRYFMFFEDLDYCRRVRKAGLKVYYLPSAQVVHYHGQSGKKLTDDANQWRRLIPSSKIYHGILKHYFVFFVMWTSQKLRKLIS